MYQSYLPFANGFLKLETDENAVLAVTMVNEEGLESPEQPEIMKKLRDQLHSYFNGELKNFDLQMAPQGTDFQQKVWAELCQIPYGKTISYDQLAQRLGDAKVIRAAASANGKNPIGIIIPCHRVIGKNGSLVGYAGGLSNKKWLLELEDKHENGVLSLFSDLPYTQIYR